MFEMLCGARITNSYMRIGGVFYDAPESFWPALRQFLAEMPEYIDEYESLMTGNEILLGRTKGVSSLSIEDIVNASISGPMLRAAGLSWDVRKSDPYDIYSSLDFEVPVGTQGDVYDRYWVRLQEMRQSLSLVEQCVSRIPQGPVRAEVPLIFRPPEGDAYVPIEAPKGELGFYIVSDGGISPYRCKIRAPSFINLTLLKEMLIGRKMADLVVILGSIDINMGEVDR